MFKVVRCEKSLLPSALGDYIATLCFGKSHFFIAISGGSLPNTLGLALKDRKDIDYSKWHVFFADERCVPLDHSDSNYLGARRELFDFVDIPVDQVYTIQSDLVGGDVDVAANEYQNRIVKAFKSVYCERQEFDLILLGLGPDGHTCSLFPNHPLLEERERSVAGICDSPKAPPNRITFTFKLVNSAKQVAFVCGGAGKAKILKEIIKEEKDYPATNVKGNVSWFLDEDAASML